GLEDGAGGGRVAAPVFVGGNLVVNEGVGFALGDFKDAGVLFVKNKNMGAFDARLGIDVAGRADLDDHGAAGLIEVGDGLDGRIFIDKKAKAGCQVRIGEGDGFGALRRFCHGGNDEVNLVRLQGGNEAVEFDVLDLHRAVETLAEGVGEIDADAAGAALLIGHLEGRI